MSKPSSHRSANAASLRRHPAVSWPKKLLFSAVTMLLCLSLFEATLMLIGVRPLTETRDPFVGFSHRIPLMVRHTDESGDPWLSTAANKQVWFNEQTFREEKPENAFRIFCLGGSTTYGRPYADATSYAGWLRELLPRIDPSRDWEVINAGGISYASYRVAAVMEELAEYDPDLFLVFTAHNEFLERRTYATMFAQSPLRRMISGTLCRTRIWAVLHLAIHGVGSHSADSHPTDARESGTPSAPSVQAGFPAQNSSLSAIDWLPAEVDEMLNHSVGPADYQRDDPWRQRVLHHYQSNLKRMVAIAESSGAQIVFITPASNEKDCSPFKSEPTDSRAATAKRVAEQRAAAERHRQQGDWHQASLVLADAVRVDPRHAALQFEYGKALYQRGDHDGAAEAFIRAVDEDVCPLRAVPAIGRLLRQFCREAQIPLVDFERRLREQCQQEQGHGCLGQEYFLDHVHPTVEVHGQLARWVAETFIDSGIADLPRPSPAQMSGWMGEVRERVQSQRDVRTEAVAMRNLAKVFHWSGKFEQALGYAQQALERIEDDPESRFIMADCLTQLGRPQEAIAAFEQLYRSVDVFPRGYLAFAELLFEHGDVEAAKAYAILAVAHAPESARGHFILGSIHLRLGEFAPAADSLQASDAIYPNDPLTLTRLAEAWLGLNDIPRAVATLQRLLSLRPDDADLHHRLGLAYLKGQQTAQAVEQFRAALRIDPQHSAATSLQVAEALQASP